MAGLFHRGGGVVGRKGSER